MALRLRDVQRDPIANRALNELMHHYTVAEEKTRLVLTKAAGDMKLFLYELDDLHQLDFVHNQQMVREIARLRVRNNGASQNVSDLRYSSLKRYLAKRFHPDYGPGQGIEKIVRTEIFKEIWNEIERLDQGVWATRLAKARSSSAA